MPIYRALSLKQPWANLIRDGHKTIETRTWATPYRGELLLCASKMPEIPPFGCAVCLVELIDCRPMRPHDWVNACIEPYAPAFGWHLANVRPVPPIPVLGTLKKEWALLVETTFSGKGWALVGSPAIVLTRNFWYHQGVWAHELGHNGGNPHNTTGPTGTYAWIMDEDVDVGATALSSELANLKETQQMVNLQAP